MPLSPAAHDPRREQRLNDKKENPVQWGDYRHSPGLAKKKEEERRERGRR